MVLSAVAAAVAVAACNAVRFTKNVNIKRITPVDQTALVDRRSRIFKATTIVFKVAIQYFCIRKRFKMKDNSVINFNYRIFEW